MLSLSLLMRPLHMFLCKQVEKTFPSCASKINTGKNETVMMSKLKNSAGPTSLAAFETICQRFSSVSGVFSICLCIFSIITIAPSVIAPIAIAIPPNDIIFALIPCICMMINEAKMPIGRVTTATIEDRK